MVIAIVGEKRVGKDTAYDIIKGELPSWERVGLGDEIKKIAADILHISLEELEQLKNDETVLMPNVTGRTILQDLGQRLKVNFGNEVWCDQAYYNIDEGKNYVITDIRFGFEVDYFREITRVVTIRVLRNTSVKKDSHPSETESKHIVTDYEIENNGSLEDFRNKLLDVLREEGLV